MFFLLTAEPNPILGGQGAAVAPAAGTAVPPPAAAPQQEGGGMNVMWMYGLWALIIVGFYFLTIRPQRKKAKQMQEMQSAIKVGDSVLTSNGLFGKIADIGHDCFVVEYGTNRGVLIPVRKSDVLGVQEPQLVQPSEAKE